MIGTWYVVQKFNRKTWEWEERDSDGSSYNSTLTTQNTFVINTIRTAKRYVLSKGGSL